jgi:hypothetical protein
MKAEEAIKKHCGIDLDKSGSEQHFVNTDMDNVITTMQEYARIQIEKDREETKRLMNEKLKDFEGLNPEIKLIIDRPIKLD